MKPWIKWTLAVLVVSLLAAGIFRALAARKAQREALAVQTEQAANTEMELQASDVTRAQSIELTRSLAISGTLKAVNSAFVKARVAGELQGLVLREGDSVKAGQVVARIDPIEYQSRLRQAQQQADAAQAQIEIAQRQFDNNKALVDQGFISKTALDTSVANLNAARATFQAAVSATDVARKTVQDTVLAAPIAGLVAQRLAQPGERVAIDARILEIVDLSRLELEAAISPAESLDIRLGQSATLQIEGSTQNLTARVVRINPSAQAGSRSVLVYLGLQAQPGLRQGLFAQGNVAIAQTRALALALGAVRTDKPLPYVQVIENNRVKHVTVGLGERGEVQGQLIVAVNGITEGTQVLAASVGTLREGTRIKSNTPTPAVGR
jgi:RND family efflux transporter MFP subunit